MKKLTLAALLFMSCATVPTQQIVRAQGYDVRWDKDASEDPFWVCLFNPEDATQLLCADFEKAFELYEAAKNKASNPQEL